ncbi:MAG: TonB-dependent receptor [Crocinitomicaceae bacterium]|nr:TonB-dependent receptor [Crocinitomicaceae bacterium]
MRFFLLLFLSLYGLPAAQGQQLLQTIRGTVTDKESHAPLIGVSVVAFRDTLLLKGNITNATGQFVLAELPVGRITLHISYLGYQNLQIDNIELTSAKEMVLLIDLEERAVDLGEIEIKAVHECEAMNEMATVSARQFSVEETNRYAGSRGDPARMASNFAGVQGADDSRNDIVIRGNSPQGVVWRMEGVDIPNPNHFAIPGTAGGPVSIINNKYLANSDFFTGAFPAEFGNSIAGIFDLRMRNGNNQKHEFSGQFGFLGTELFAEGPLSKSSGSSYLASYRYSTLELFSLLGIKIGTDATPHYQDGAFRVALNGKNGGVFSLWGIGGKSSVDILISDQKTPDERNIYGENDRDQYFRSRIGIAGSTYHKSFSEKLFFKATLAASVNHQGSFHEIVYRHLENRHYKVDSMAALLDYTFSESKFSASLLLNHKIDKKNILRAGVLVDEYLWNYVDSVRIIDTARSNYYQWTTRWDSKTSGLLAQPYIQWKFRLGDRWMITAGWHLSYFSLSNSASFVEPRVGVKWQVNQRRSLSLGAGRHSQLQPTYMYFYNPGLAVQPSSKPLNSNMDFTKSDHLVLSCEENRGKWRLRIESYYQRVFNIPVEKKISSFSLVNTGAGFTRFFPDTLVNAGTGKNYGVEFTAERFFYRGWLFLFTASLFDSKYKGSDGIERNTDFNGHYALNLLGSKEWAFSKNRSLTTGSKITTAGGRWYGPADISASNRERELVYVDSLRNSQQFRPYFRIDIKINYKINRKKVVHETGIDLINVLNTKNILKLTYSPDESGNPQKAIREEYQLGFLPIFYYRADF